MFLILKRDYLKINQIIIGFHNDNQWAISDSEAMCKVFIIKTRFHCYEKKLFVSCEKLSTQPRFHNEVHSNLVMVYSVHYKPIRSQVTITFALTKD